MKFKDIELAVLTGNAGPMTIGKLFESMRDTIQELAQQDGAVTPDQVQALALSVDQLGVRMTATEQAVTSLSLRLDALEAGAAA